MPPACENARCHVAENSVSRRNLRGSCGNANPQFQHAFSGPAVSTGTLTLMAAEIAVRVKCSSPLRTEFVPPVGSSCARCEIGASAAAAGRRRVLHHARIPVNCCQWIDKLLALYGLPLVRKSISPRRRVAVRSFFDPEGGEHQVMEMRDGTGWLRTVHSGSLRIFASGKSNAPTTEYSFSMKSRRR